MDGEALQPLLPKGLEVDVVDGTAWVALTPFMVERFAVGPAPPLPFFSRFPETNLRTYVRDEDGRDGLFFLSLDVSSAFNAGSGRLAGIPYHLSRMSVRGEDRLRYLCRRVVGAAAHHDIVVRPGPLIDPAGVDDCVHSLTGRWRAFDRVRGRLYEVAVEHEPWPLATADLVHIDESLSAAAELPPLGGEVMVHHSPGVDARLGRPRARQGRRRAG